MTIDRARILCSFSGGRTSALMAALMMHESNADVRFVFANTGLEHEETLRFVHRVDQFFGLGLVWIEAVTHLQRGKGASYKIVDFETAARSGEPFEGMVKKHGVPNKNFPHCTRESKSRPIKAYCRETGWKTGTYKTAIGIRADEMDRVSPSAKKDHIIYPLVTAGITKRFVLDFWRGMPFDLYIPERWGNCKTCWKKSLRKLLTNAAEAPEEFEFFDRLERQYGLIGPGVNGTPKVMFREGRNTSEILRLSALPFQPHVDEDQVFDPELDVGEDCSDSCEVDLAA